MGQQISSEEKEALEGLYSRCKELISRIETLRSQTDDFKTLLQLGFYQKELTALHGNISYLIQSSVSEGPGGVQKSINRYTKIFDSCEIALNEF